MAGIGVLFLASSFVGWILVDNWIDAAAALSLSLVAAVCLVFAYVRSRPTARPVDRAELGRLVTGGTVILGAAAAYRAIISPLEDGNVIITMETGFPAAGLLLLATVLRGFLAMFAAGSKRLNLSIGAAALTLVAWALFVSVLDFHVSAYAFIGTFVIFSGTIVQDVLSRNRGIPASDARTPTETDIERDS